MLVFDYMKNLLQKVPCLALVMLLCVFVSCAKEDDMPDPVNPVKEETWIMTYDDYRYIADKRPEYHNLTREVTVAIDNDVVSIKGIFDKYRDTWIKCTYDAKTGSIRFPQIQPIGFEERDKIFFRSGVAELPLFYEVCDNIEFRTKGHDIMYYSWDKNFILSKDDDSVEAFWYEKNPGEYLEISPDSTSSGKAFSDRDFVINMSFSKKSAPTETSKCLDFTSKAPGDFANLGIGRYLGVDSLIIRGRMNYQDFRQIRWLIKYGNLSVINLENAEPGEEDSVVFEQTWKYNSPLQEIILPKHLKKIPAKAFRGCYTLENIVLPEQYESIGDSAFWGCENIRSFRIPATCLSIGDSAFYRCMNIKSLQIPATCLSIGRYVWGECEKLSDVSIPSNLKKIPEGMFYRCRSLKRIEIPAGVDEIGKEAFESTGLEEIDLPEGLKEIADYTFNGCRSLKEITIPDGVERIGEGAFGHAGLERIHLPKNLQYIDCWAFEGLSKLEELILPASLKTIEGGAFVRLTSLKRIYCLATTPPKCRTTELVVGDRHNPVRVPVFEWTVWPYEDNPSRDIPVYVPNGSSYRYMIANGWSYFQNFIETDPFPDL